MEIVKYYILAILTFYSFLLLAQNGPAIIKDTDGFTNVRSGPGMKFNVVDTLFDEDFFYYKFGENPNWAKVSAWKGRQIEGYIHKSRIQIVKNLDNITLKNLISKILEKQRNLASNFRTAWKLNDKLAYRTAVKKLEHYNDTKYDPLLQVIPSYFCLTSDAEIINKFFATMWADKGSANEMPSLSIGECYICNSDIVIERLEIIENKEKKVLILNNIEWGLMNYFNVDEDGNSTNKEYKVLMGRLEKSRIK